jgi:hypothetical protein
MEIVYRGHPGILTQFALLPNVVKRLDPQTLGRHRIAREIVGLPAAG